MVIISFINNVLRQILPDRIYLKVLYWWKFSKYLNLQNPKTFNEKMQWLKLNDRQPWYHKLVDKYQVKQFVAERIGDKYVIPLLGVWDKPTDIEYDKLPEKFVLKCTHDSGSVIVVQDKATIDKREIGAQLTTALQCDYYSRSKEWVYKGLTPRIIAETYIENKKGQGIDDYKIWCFNGRVEYLKHIAGRLANCPKERFYDREWKPQDFHYINPLMEETIPPPICLQELIEAAEKLAEGIPFARVDFYVLDDGSIKFGEITFYPASGFSQWRPAEMDEVLGELIKLPHIKGD